MLNVYSEFNMDIQFKMIYNVQVSMYSFEVAAFIFRMFCSPSNKMCECK